MLHLTPEDTIMFKKTKFDNDYSGVVEISNVSSNVVTFKIKTTSPEKFRVKPSLGILGPGDTTRVLVVLQHGRQAPLLGKDKFLVICMQIPEDVATNILAITELWKITPATSLQIEQHRLKCSLINQSGECFKNGRFGGLIDGNDIPNQIQNLNSTLHQQVQINEQLQSQLKYTQILQWLILLTYIIISIGIIYVLKKEIKEQTTGFFDKGCTNYQPNQEL